MLHGSDAKTHFVGIEAGGHRIPNEAIILNIRRLLESHRLTEQLFAEVSGLRSDQEITLR